MCTKQQHTHLHKANNPGFKRPDKHKQLKWGNSVLHYHKHTNNNNNKIRVAPHFQKNGLNIYLQSVPPATIDYTPFSMARGIFYKTNHIRSNNASISNYKRIKIVPRILSDHSAMNLEISDKEKTETM